METFPVRVAKQILHIPSKRPYFVQLAITDICNLDCEMCPRHHVATNTKHGDFATLSRIIDRLHGVEEISLVGLGEPLTHPRFFDLVAYCKQKGMIVKTTSNGLLLKKEKIIQQLVSSGLDTISFSMESIKDQDDNKIHSNAESANFIQNLIQAKKAAGATLPKIALQTVMVKGAEKDLFEVIAWAGENRIDRVNVLRMTKYFETGLDRPSVEEEKLIFREIAKLRKKHGIRVDALQDQFFTGLKGIIYKYSKHLLRLDSFCMRLLDYPYITQDGEMVPCCVLPEQKFGNVLTEDIDVIWRSARIRAFRKQHDTNALCVKCDNYRLKQVI
jgi:MoaA/NifB/PqqE/SkfB family radical SAM enzyme